MKMHMPVCTLAMLFTQKCCNMIVQTVELNRVFGVAGVAQPRVTHQQIQLPLTFATNPPLILNLLTQAVTQVVWERSLEGLLLPPWFQVGNQVVVHPQLSHNRFPMGGTRMDTRPHNPFIYIKAHMHIECRVKPKGNGFTGTRQSGAKCKFDYPEAHG